VAAVRIAAIADVHGNALALEAVLAEVARERPDRIVVCGDVAAGPEPRAVLDRLMELEGARFVRGNADRELVEAFDRGSEGDAGWVAERLDRAHRDFLAGFADAVQEEGVLFCHGSPRSDTEILTSLTPEAHVRHAVAGVAERLVVGGHTHVQYVRSVGRTRLVNAGSVGMAYEGRRGAFWAIVGDRVELRRTDYDYERAAGRVRASGYPDAESFAAENVLDPPDATAAEGLFERMAIERGERD
jgi:putative phosphoesterase